MNWRKPLIMTLLPLTGSRLPFLLSRMHRMERWSGRKLEAYSQNKLKRLLVHAYTHVPYYTKVLKDAGVIIRERRNISVNMKQWSAIPVLTREIVRKEFSNLKSDDCWRRRTYMNHTGGSTGQPMNILQDKRYEQWNYANKIYYKTFGGQKIGDPELRLWSSEAEVLRGKEDWRVRLRNWLYNRTDLSSFKMTEEDKARFARTWNAVQPGWVETYVLSITEFSKYLKRKKIKLHKPRGIVITAETVYPHLRELVQSVIGSRVYNRYGGREVGDIACSCDKNEQLHVSTWNNRIEILDKKLRPAKPGEIGTVYVTNLNNYAMPLIRYRIGDIAVPAKKTRCRCGRATPLIDRVEGRIINVFKTKEGHFISGGFFVHFVGSVFNTGFIKRFQIIQKDYDHIHIKIALSNKSAFKRNQQKIEREIRKMMGKDCRVTWQEVQDIKPLKSGKYLYTLSEVVEGRRA